MEISNAERQVQEIRNLQEQWYSDAIEVKTPALLSRINRAIDAHSQQSQRKRSSSANNTTALEVKKCISIHINCTILYPDELPNLILAFSFPMDYPSTSVCQIQVLHTSEIDSEMEGSNRKEYQACTSAIQEYIHSFCGCECVELALDWIKDNKDTCLTISNDSNDISKTTGSSTVGKVQCYVLRYNHLLSGPEHKKEKAMIDAAKKLKLQGALLWGTPGIVIIVPPSTEEDAKEYASSCRTIGKRPDGVDDTIWMLSDSLEGAGIGGLAQQKRGGRLQELDTAGLRAACANDENLLRMTLGLQ